MAGSGVHPAATAGEPRDLTATLGATRLPCRPRPTTMPRSRSLRYAAATVVGETPRLAASSRTGTSWWPGKRCPWFTCSSIWSLISLAERAAIGLLYHSMTKNVPVHNDPISPDAVPDQIRVRRAEARADYQTESVYAVIDAGLVAHVGTIRAGLPVVIPMFCVRDGDTLLLHGAPATGVIRRGQEGIDVCVTMTLLDGLVLARSSFHHSMNYRSVVVIGTAEVLTDHDEKDRALDLFVERLMPGRQAELRPTTKKEVQGTGVLRLSLANASTKSRTGPPIDDEEDYDLDVWAGVVPMHTVYEAPTDDPRLRATVPVPDKVTDLVGGATGGVTG